jgi:hypothetical protein
MHLGAIISPIIFLHLLGCSLMSHMSLLWSDLTPPWLLVLCKIPNTVQLLLCVIRSSQCGTARSLKQRLTVCTA